MRHSVPDLNLVAVPATGKYVAFCKCRLDPLTGIAEMESVDARPECSGLKLDGAFLSEALRRVKKCAPNLVCAVDIDISESMNQILEDPGFVRSARMNMWGKRIANAEV